MEILQGALKSPVPTTDRVNSYKSSLAKECGWFMIDSISSGREMAKKSLFPNQILGVPYLLQTCKTALRMCSLEPTKSIEFPMKG